MRRVIIPVIIVFLLTAILPGTCWADTTAPSASLTVEQAIELALKNNKDIQQAELSLAAAGISSDLAWESADAQKSVSSIDQLLISDYNVQAAQKGYDTKLESVQFSVYSKYYAVVSALDSVEAQRLANQQAEEKLRISKLRYTLGMDTRLADYQAQQQAVSAQSSYAVAEQSLDQKYIALMDFIGLANTSRPALVRELSYTPVEVTHPESKFNDIVNKSPSVWLAKRSLTLQEDTRVNSLDLQGDLSDINVEKANITIITTRDQMLQITRSLYYNILSLEESYATAKEGARTADEALRVAKLLYEAGMGTKLEVTAAEIAAHNAHQALNSQSYQHAILKMAFEKPWAYGSAN